ncbi:MAG: hypothetical protein A2428_03040 [Bdellovibrionales bacterium RIFOXYC1_FULL_54_43]|nr:MAG: hypothetical protein A2428_03040 [Bdellovibrionales bacterium RIFOXYC1_FULL_54_43]OFZ82657.1 MAG: hypothetical protein A2603_02475 [Bdellovibrionales bacterium RIFOXYD1_FULL_55_31]
MTCTEGAHKGVVTCNCTWQGLLDDLRKAREECAQLERKLGIAVECLDTVAQCGGGCDGPLGCMCKAPLAKEARAKIRGSVG